MQTFFNPTTPFFDAEGHPMVGARVSFLDLSTSASLIELTDNEGTPLPNPLFTGSDGRLRLENGNGAPAVPCIADGLSYKVVVARKTGVEPIFMGGILQNPEELYENPFIAFVVTAMGGSGAGSNTSVIGSVADVRLADKTLGSVVCSGYYEAGDCPARVFTWVESQEPPQDNGINVLRNPEDNTGYWKMSDPPAGTWDVRMAGLTLYGADAAQNSVRLQALLNAIGELLDVETAATRIYFPKGVWHLSAGFTSYSEVVFGYGSMLRFTGSSSKVVNLYGGVESYGADNISDLKLFDCVDGGYAVIYAPEAHTCWVRPNSHAVATDTLVVDWDSALSTFWFGSPRKCVVKVDSTNVIDFNGCEIECDGKLSKTVGYSFTNCRFTDRYFKDNTFSDDVTLSGCTLDIDDFASVENWAKTMLMNGATVLDFNGKRCDSFTLQATAANRSYRVLNGNFRRFTFRAPDSVTDGNQSNSLQLEHCRVEELDGDWFWKDLYVIDSYVAVGYSVYTHTDPVMATDGLLVKGALLVRNSDVAGINDGGIAVGSGNSAYLPSTVTLMDSRIVGNVNGLAVDATRTSFTGVLKQWAGDSTTFSVKGCTFSGTAHAETLGTSAIIVDNRFLRSGIPEDAVVGPNLTSCTYEGNGGNCLQKKLKINAQNRLRVTATSQSNIDLRLELNVSEIPLHLFGCVQSNIRVRFVVDVREASDSQEASNTQNRYSTITGSVIYVAADPRTFQLPHSEALTMPAITDGASVPHYVNLKVPDGIDPTNNYAAITGAYIEAEIID